MNPNLGLEIFWGMAILVTLGAAYMASSKATSTEGALDLEANNRVYQLADIRKGHEALERTVDSQTKRLNDHYSAIAGLRAESRRQRSELRQLTRTVEALAASHGRQNGAIGELVRRAQSVEPKKGGKK